MKICLLFVLFVLPLGVVSQKQMAPIVYSIMYKKNEIGTLKALTYEEGGLLVYEVKTTITKKIFYIKHFVYDLIVKYKDNMLFSSDYKLYINEKLKKTATLNTKGKDLIALINGKTSQEQVEPIAFSSALLYFKEPKGITRTYSESKLKPRILDRHPEKENTYILDKNLGEYYYQHGQLQKMTLDNVVYVEMVRQ